MRHTFIYSLETALGDIKPVKGNKNNGKSAVAASGIISPTQYIDITNTHQIHLYS